MNFSIIYFTIFLLFANTNIVFAQQNKYVDSAQIEPSAEQIADGTSKYVNLRAEKFNNYFTKSKKETNRLLKKIAKQEKKILKKLQSKDSMACNNLKNKVSFDSIKSLANNKKQIIGKGKNAINSSIDSLQNITNYVNKLATKANTIGINTDAIANVKNKFEYEQYIKQLIANRQQDLKNAVAKYPDLQKNMLQIDKQTFYYKERLTYYKNLANNSTALEEKGLQFIMGTTGLSNGFNNNDAMPSGNEAELAKMGYQTKSVVNKQINTQLNTSNPQQLQALNNKIGETKKQYQALIGKTKSVKKEIGKFKKTNFTINPIQCVPLKARFEKSFTWQIVPAKDDLPVTLNTQLQLGLKLDKNFTTAIGLGTSLGLGKNMYNIKPSYQGATINTNVDWKAIWGISIQAGAERQFAKYQTNYIATRDNGIPNQTITTNKYYRDIVYTGLMKTYKLNAKYNGTFLLAYNFLNNQYNNQSPWIVRWGWKK
jgi:hypothetical protein